MEKQELLKLFNKKMEKYLLDTNICIFSFKKKFDVDKHFQRVGLDNCAISEITLAELIYGAECSLDFEKNINIVNNFIKNIQIIPISNVIWLYAKEKALLKKAGKMIDDFDILIGVTAIANNMILVTDNEKHLSRLSNIRIENWISR